MGTAYSLVALAQWYSEGVRQYGKTGFTRAAASFNPSDLQVDMTGKTVVVTGANKGLGRETADAIAKLGASVHSK
jgi:dehydrogenase/reductase SDR family protein 12